MPILELLQNFRYRGRSALIILNIKNKKVSGIQQNELPIITVLLFPPSESY